MMATASMGSSWSDLIGQLSVNSHSISDSLKALDAFRAAASDVSPEAIASLEMRENAVTFLLEMSNEAMNDICGEVSRGDNTNKGVHYGPEVRQLSAALDGLRILLRCNDATTEKLCRLDAVQFLVKAANLPVTNRGTSTNDSQSGLESAYISEHPSVPALKCLVNLQMHRKLDVMLRADVISCLVGVLRGGGDTRAVPGERCRRHALAAHLAFMIIGLAPDPAYSLFLSACAGIGTAAAAKAGANISAATALKLIVPLLAWVVESAESDKLKRDETMATPWSSAKILLISSLLKLLQLVCHMSFSGASGVHSSVSPLMPYMDALTRIVGKIILRKSRVLGDLEINSSNIRKMRTTSAEMAVKLTAVSLLLFVGSNTDEATSDDSSSSVEMLQFAERLVKMTPSGRIEGIDHDHCAATSKGDNVAVTRRPGNSALHEMLWLLHYQLEERMVLLRDQVWRRRCFDAGSAACRGKVDSDTGGTKPSKLASATSKALPDPLPVVAALQKLTSASSSARLVAKEVVFPSAADAIWQKKLSEEGKDKTSEAAASCISDRSSTAAASAEEQEHLRFSQRQRQMQPIDAPVGTLRWHLVALVTGYVNIGNQPSSFPSDISEYYGPLPDYSNYGDRLKRCASELLLTLCEDDFDELTLRAGFGASSYMMHVRGALKLSSSSPSE